MMTPFASALRRAVLKSPMSAVIAVLVLVLVLVPALSPVPPALGMGASTPPPPPVRVERAAPARPAPPAKVQAQAQAPDEAAPPAAQPQAEHLRASEVTPEQLLYRRRAVVVFADTPADPAFAVQMAALKAQAGPLAERDAVVISDSDPADRSVWRQRLAPQGFSLVIIDKDGQVKQRKPQPRDMREIIRIIDTFPSRLEEIARPATAP